MPRHITILMPGPAAAVRACLASSVRSLPYRLPRGGEGALSSKADKRYDRYDFSSYRGAEEAYRVRDVRPPPPSDEEAARQAAARASAARQVPNQTRAAVRLGLQLLE